MAELTAPFVFKNDEKRIVYGPVLVPDEPDTDNDVVTEEQIETVAHNFVEEYGNIDLMHSLNNVGKMIESYILPMDLELENEVIVPKGSWMLGVRVTNDDSWQAVKDGKLSGFSIMAIEKMALKSAESTAEKNEAQKRTTLSDLQDGWIVNAVSLVDEPAVPKAKFIAIKSKSKKKQQEEITEETVQKAINGSLEHRKQLVRSKVYQTFDSERTDSYVHSTLDDSVIVRIEDYVTNQRKMYQIGYSIDEQGNVEFTDQPQEVTIQETVVSVSEESTGGISLNSQEEVENNTSEKSNDGEGVFSKLFKKLGLRSTEKAGRTISDANFNKLKAAKEVIDELLSVGEKERSNKSQKGADDMEKDQVQALIDESMEPINSKLDDVLKSMKAEAKGEGSNEEETQSSEKEKDDKEDNQEKDESTKEDKSTKSKDENEQDDTEDYKEKYEQAIKQLEKRPFSHRLAGQDDGAHKSKDDDEEKESRNAFGFKRK